MARLKDVYEARTVITADDRTRAAIERAKRGMKGMSDASKRRSEAMKRHWASVSRSLKTIGVVATAALAAMTVATVKAVAAANEQERAEKMLEVALGRRSQALLDNAAALQQVTTFGDEVTIKAMSMIASFVKEEDAIKKATQASMDLATAKGMNLVAAADLVSKTLGSTTNAMSRYGIQVTGAVGSTERLESLTKSIADVFGGQAQATAATFGGRVEQLKNAHGDLWEELGFVITKSEVFNNLVRDIVVRVQAWTTAIKDNRAGLMDMAEDGFIAVVNGIGKVLEVMRFFHNAWSGIKLVASLAFTGLLDGLRLVWEGLRFILKPLDLIFKGLVKIGQIESNPFDTINEGLKNWQLSQRDVTAEVLASIETTNSKYDAIKTTLTGVAEKMREVRAAAEVDEAVQSEDASLQETLAQEEELHRQSDEQVLAFHKAFVQRKLEADRDALRKEAALLSARKQTWGIFYANIGAIGQQFGKGAFKIAKALAVTETLMNTYTGAQAAFKAMAGIPIIGPALGAAAAAAAVAAGLARVAQIRSMRLSESPIAAGGGSVSGSTATTVAAGVSPALTQTQPVQAGPTIHIEVHGDALDKDGLARAIAENIREAGGDGFDFGTAEMEMA